MTPAPSSMGPNQPTIWPNRLSVTSPFSTTTSCSALSLPSVAPTAYGPKAAMNCSHGTAFSARAISCQKSCEIRMSVTWCIDQCVARTPRTVATTSLVASKILARSSISLHSVMMSSSSTSSSSNVGLMLGVTAQQDSSKVRMLCKQPVSSQPR